MKEEGSQAGKRCVSFSKSQERRWWVNTPVWKEGDGEFFCQPLITFFWKPRNRKTFAIIKNKEKRILDGIKKMFCFMFCVFLEFGSHPISQ